MHGGFITFYAESSRNHLYIPIGNPAPLFKRLHVCTYLVVSGKVISGEYSINTISMENSNQFIYT